MYACASHNTKILKWVYLKGRVPFKKGARPFKGETPPVGVDPPNSAFNCFYKACCFRFKTQVLVKGMRIAPLFAVAAI
jgi:hypothetical protein